MGGGFFSGDRGQAFYGVGAASNISNASLRRSVSDTQARADLSRVFQSRISNFIKIYSRSISGGPEEPESAEQFAQEATTAFTSMDLSGSQIVDHYFDTQEKTMYALAMLNAESFRTQVEDVADLNQETREYILENAEKAFDELERNEEQQ